MSVDKTPMSITVTNPMVTILPRIQFCRLNSSRKFDYSKKKTRFRSHRRASVKPSAPEIF